MDIQPADDPKPNPKEPTPPPSPPSSASPMISSEAFLFAWAACGIPSAFAAAAAAYSSAYPINPYIHYPLFGEKAIFFSLILAFLGVLLWMFASDILRGEPIPLSSETLPAGGGVDGSVPEPSASSPLGADRGSRGYRTFSGWLLRLAAAALFLPAGFLLSLLFGFRWF